MSPNDMLMQAQRAGGGIAPTRSQPGPSGGGGGHGQYHAPHDLPLERPGIPCSYTWYNVVNTVFE
jgi:hypothetical protein